MPQFKNCEPEVHLIKVSTMDTMDEAINPARGPETEIMTLHVNLT